MSGDTKRRRGSDDVEEHRERPVPACVQRYHTNRRGHRGPGVAALWTDKEWSEGLSAFRRPCRNQACFPDGGGPNVGETVVESQRAATVVHRPGEPPEPDAAETGPRTDADQKARWQDCEPLVSLADLRVGDGVIWNSRRTPLVVTAIQWPIEPEATVRGPDGGTYTLEQRSRRDFWAYPSGGRVARVVHFPTDPDADADPPLSE